MTKLEWLRSQDKAWAFGQRPPRLVARCEDCGQRAQVEGEKYDREKVYQFVINHEGHSVSAGAVTGEA